MEPNKGKIKLKINLSKEDSKFDKNEKIEKLEDIESLDEIDKIRKSERLRKHDDMSNFGYSDEGNQSKDDYVDDSTILSDQKVKEKSLEKQIISVISKLTKIVCICENKNNSMNSDDNKKIHKKLVTQMYKYEKALNHLNSFINDTTNNNLYNITFPLGLIKMIDSYNSGDSWIYKYLLLEQKKYNDMHRKLIQNISAFDATLRTKIVKKEVTDVTMPIYASVKKEKQKLLNKKAEENYYKNIHIPKELVDHYIKNIKKRKLQ